MTDRAQPTTSQSVTIRPATLNDRPSIDAFAAVVVPDTYGPLAGPDYADSLLVWWGEALDPDITAGNVSLAFTDGEVVGVAHIGDVESTPVLWKLYVHPARRSAGIGTALLDHVIAALPAETTRLLLEHIAANVDAARFYRRHGFARTRVDPHDDYRLATVWRARQLNPLGNGNHGHGHEHDEVDWSNMAGHLAAWDRALGTVYADMAVWLDVRSGMRVADIGSGAGGFAAALAARVGPTGQLTLIDTNTKLLDIARSHQPTNVDVTTVCADLDHQQLPAELAGRFDLVHASGVVHHTDDQLRTIGNLTALLAPGGRLVLGEGGLATRFLPSECGIGEPDLEARIHAATTDWFWAHVRPVGATTTTTAGWGTLLASAALTGVKSHTFLLDIPAPLGHESRSLVAATLAATAARLGHRIAPDDGAAIAALVDPARTDSVHHRPDVFVLHARTIHVGVRPG
jgi:SAM-dependent methyltransferase